MEQLFDEQFVNRLKQGDPDAERAFFAHFSTAVRNRLRGRIRSPELVEDIRQETLLRVLRHLRSDKPVDHLPAFVHGVSKNVTLELTRSQGRHPQIADSLPELVDPGPDQEAEVALSERQSIVRKVLAQLSSKDREVLGLVYLDEVERAEACRQLKIGPGYLRVVLFRARSQFRKVLERKDKRV